MATQTSFLGLVVPLNNEYQNTWDQPLNSNWQLIDAFAKVTNDELVAARFGKTDLASFLAVAHNSDGTLQATAEVIRARNSFTYGDLTLSETPFSLSDRLNAGDREVFDAREGSASLRAAVAFRNGNSNSVIAGSANSNGYPSWLGFTGANVQVDGSITPLWMTINGYLSRIRKLTQLAISGAFGTRFVYAQYAVGGQKVLNGDSANPPPSVASGTTGLSPDNDEVCIFQDLTVDFTTVDVKPGDILTILGNGTNGGDYQISAIAPDGNHNQIQISGKFPGGSLSSQNYVIFDALAVTLGSDTVKTPVAGKFYIAEADYDGVSAITAVRPIHFKDTFIGEWRAVDVTTGGGAFEQIWNHNLFDDALELSVQVSQANDGSAPVQELVLSSTLSSSLGVTISNGLNFDPGTFNPGSSGATYSPPPSLTGTVTGSISGAVAPDSAALAQWTKNSVNVKNAVASVFYKDYSGAARTSGFIRVVLRKKRA